MVSDNTIPDVEVKKEEMVQISRGDLDRLIKAQKVDKVNRADFIPPPPLPSIPPLPPPDPRLPFDLDEVVAAEDELGKDEKEELKRHGNLVSPLEMSAPLTSLICEIRVTMYEGLAPQVLFVGGRRPPSGADVSEAVKWIKREYGTQRQRWALGKENPVMISDEVGEDEVEMSALDEDLIREEEEVEEVEEQVTEEENE